MGRTIPFEHLKWSTIIFGKACLGAIFDQFWFTQWPIFKAFWDLRGAKMAQNGLKMDSFHLIVHPKWFKVTFGKAGFSPVFDPFLVPKRPIFNAFWVFRAKTHHHRLKSG